MDVSLWSQQISSILEDDDLYIPGLDLETRLIARKLMPDKRFLSPSDHALESISKPPIEIARILEIPTSESLASPSRQELESFIRGSPFGVWVKGQHYEATLVYTANDALIAGRAIQKTWGTSWHIERNQHGQECSIVFAAREGSLVDAAFMAKTQITPAGKTWSGRVQNVDDETRTLVSRLAEHLRWDGGGEIEMIESWEGDRTLIELNPRFPAWIHGATQVGINLPAALVTGEPVRSSCLASGFTRIVSEIPTSPELGHNPFSWTSARSIAVNGKHPSRMPSLAKRMESDEPAQRAAISDQRNDVFAKQLRSLSIPEQRFSEAGAVVIDAAEFERRVKLLSSFSNDTCSIAYSVKTFPHPEILQTAAKLGLSAEVISTGELKSAIRAGFDPTTIVMNGPTKWWPETESVACGAIFADSIAELNMIANPRWNVSLNTEVVGFRLAPSIPSRFGVELRSPSDLQDLAQALSNAADHYSATWGVHFHHAQSDIGTHAWLLEIHRLLRITKTLEQLIGMPPAVVDFGGGWHYDDLPTAVDQMRIAITQLRDEIEGVQVVIEPGKLLTQACGIRLARVIAMTDGGDAVASIGIPEIPLAHTFAHPVAVVANDLSQPLAAGNNRLLGRTCMENDVLATEVDTRRLKVGDALAVGMCGAYDLSMSYEFGLGELR